MSCAQGEAGQDSPPRVAICNPIPQPQGRTHQPREPPILLLRALNCNAAARSRRATSSQPRGYSDPPSPNPTNVLMRYGNSFQVADEPAPGLWRRKDNLLLSLHICGGTGDLGDGPAVARPFFTVREAVRGLQSGRSCSREGAPCGAAPTLTRKPLLWTSGLARRPA